MNTNEQSIDLETAQSLILKTCGVLAAEDVSLAKSLNRFPATSLTALEDLPGYDQSLRDGYAISKQLPGVNTQYAITGEVAAGDTRQLVLGEGEAIRIMTGGLIPTNTVAVIPKELCRVEGDFVESKDTFLGQQPSFIHARGSDLAKGEVIAPEGEVISPEKQILLAGVGHNSVPLVRKAQIGFLCTGSELVTTIGEKIDGKKFSANSHLLQGLIHLAGAEVRTQKTVKDEPDTVQKSFTEMSFSGCDIIISTGGMGPGKFDLVEEAFTNAGGKIIYSSLYLRPGKSTLFGVLGESLFFGMPGPPPAVQLLFNELIRPAIFALQGAKSCCPRKIQAHLTEDFFFPKRELPRLKSGLMSFDDGKCFVRFSGKKGASNCYVFCPAAGGELKRNTKVTVHLTGLSPCLG